MNCFAWFFCKYVLSFLLLGQESKDETTVSLKLTAGLNSLVAPGYLLFSSVVQRQSPEDCAGERCVTSSQWALGGPSLRCTGHGEMGGVLGDV